MQRSERRGVASDDGIAADEPTECLNPKAAVMRAEALLRKEGHRPGAIAFSRTGDLATGHFSDAKVIRKFGEVGRRRDSMQLQLLAWNRQWHGCRAILQLAPDQRARGNTGAVLMKRTAAAHQEPKPLKNGYIRMTDTKIVIEAYASARAAIAPPQS